MNINLKSYTVDTLTNCINFLLDNTFIHFGPLVFQLIKGITINIICSPLLADLYLTWLEFHFMQGLNKND